MLKITSKIIILVFMVLGSSAGQDDSNSNAQNDSLTTLPQETNISSTEEPKSESEDAKTLTPEETTENPIQNERLDVNAKNDEVKSKLDDMRVESESRNNQKVILDQISLLSGKILDLVEQFAYQSDSSSKPQDDTKKRRVLLSFETDINSNRKMTVNNNFQAKNMETNQVYVEKGTGAKQPPSPNIQMTLPNAGVGQQQKQGQMQNQQNYQNGYYQNDQRKFPYQQIPIIGNNLNNFGSGK